MRRRETVQSRAERGVCVTDLSKEFDRFHMLSRYLPPAAPTLRSAPPCGEQWLHEVEFDGWRIQLHKHGTSAAAFTKNGHDHSSRVRWMVDALACLKGVRSLVIDGEGRQSNSSGSSRAEQGAGLRNRIKLQNRRIAVTRLGQG
jgi:ATP-dependent DNA ligase